MTQTWYRIALARNDHAPTLVAASGEHLGLAIAAAEHHVRGAYAIAVDVATPDAVPLGESVGKHHVVELGDAPAVPTFHWPVGVLPQLVRASELAGVRRGFTERPHDTLFVIEAQTDAEHLTDLFLGLIERLPRADNLEVRVLDHFEDAKATDVWLTSRVDGRRVIRFLDDHDELIESGHVELSVYVRAQKATLRLTEHKTVVWLADDRSSEVDLARWLGELGTPRVDVLPTVADAPHYHYRPARSRDRKKLGEELYRQRLRRVAAVKA